MEKDCRWLSLAHCGGRTAGQISGTCCPSHLQERTLPSCAAAVSTAAVAGALEGGLAQASPTAVLQPCCASQRAPQLALPSRAARPLMRGLAQAVTAPAALPKARCKRPSPAPRTPALEQHQSRHSLHAASEVWGAQRRWVPSQRAEALCWEGAPALLGASVRSSTQVTCRRSGAAMTLARRITRSGVPAEGPAIASGSAATAAVVAAWRHTEPSAQPVASSNSSPKDAHDRAVTQDACAMNDPTCTSRTMVVSKCEQVNDDDLDCCHTTNPRTYLLRPVRRRPCHHEPDTQQSSDNCMDSGMGKIYLQHAQTCHTEEVPHVRQDSTLTRANLATRSVPSAAAEYSSGNRYLHSHTLPAFVLTATSEYLLDLSLHAGDHATCMDTFQ